MTIRSRLAAGLVTIAIILIGPLVFAIQSLQRLHGDAVALRDREFAASLLVGRLREGLNDLRRQELALLFSKDAATRDAMDRQVLHVAALADSLSHFQLPAYARDIRTSVQTIAIVAPFEYRAALADDTTVADSLSSKVFVPAMTHADSTVARAEDELRSRASERVADQARRIMQTTTASIVALFMALLIAAAIAIWLTRSISHPVLDLQAGMRAVADGDLEYRVRVARNNADEFEQLADSFEEMTRQLRELDKLKAEFVSVASHELKTPINVIIGYLQLLEENVYGPLTAKQLDVHRTLIVQADTLLRLVNHLLDVSRFEAGGGRIEPRTVVLDDMLSELESAFHVLAVQREIKFHVERRAGLPDQVYWDLDRMNEMLGNLLSNAFKFTTRNGSIDLVFEPADDGVHIIVRDTGAGIPPDQVARVFDKFYQADNQSSARAAGTGLGLAIVKQIVDAHAGTITCESTQGVGTTFSITLPTRVTRRSSLQRAIPAHSA